MQTFRVLVVEDNPEDILLLKRSLEVAPDQVRIDLARNAKEAVIYLEGLSAFKEPLPRVVVIDLSASHRDGIGLLRWIRERPEFAPACVLVLGDQANTCEVDAAFELGATSFISKKPGAPEIVQEVLRLCSDSKQDSIDVSALASMQAMSMHPEPPPNSTYHATSGTPIIMY